MEIVYHNDIITVNSSEYFDIKYLVEIFVKLEPIRNYNQTIKYIIDNNLSELYVSNKIIQYCKYKSYQLDNTIKYILMM